MPSNVVAMPLPVRWYRNRRRCLLIYGLPAVAPLAVAAFLIVAESSLVWTVLGAAAFLVAVWLAVGAALAGLGVDRDWLIVRSPLLTQHRLPWAEIASFDVAEHGKNGESVVFVACADGRRLHTGGCTFPPGPDGHSRAGAMAFGLKTDGLARSGPGQDASRTRHARTGPRQMGLSSPGWLTPRRAHSGHLWTVMLFGVVLLGAAGLLLDGGITALGPALRASHGQGVRGRFVAETLNCGRHSCSWNGNFALPNGTVTLSNVSFNASTRDMSAGQSVAALDTGDTSMVFPVNDGTQWLSQVEQIAFGAFLLAFSVFLIVYLTIRARRLGSFHAALLSGTG
jgi:hypothetical protein